MQRTGIVIIKSNYKEELFYIYGVPVLTLKLIRFDLCIRNVKIILPIQTMLISAQLSTYSTTHYCHDCQLCSILDKYSIGEISFFTFATN